MLLQDKRGNKPVAQYVYEIWALGQRVIPQSHAAVNRGAALAQAHAQEACGFRPKIQADPTGLVELLWALLPGSNASGEEVCQRCPDCVDDAEVQALCLTENTGWRNDWSHCQQAAQAVRTLASKQCRRVRLTEVCEFRAGCI